MHRQQGHSKYHIFPHIWWQRWDSSNRLKEQPTPKASTFEARRPDVTRTTSKEHLCYFVFELLCFVKFHIVSVQLCLTSVLYFPFLLVEACSRLIPVRPHLEDAWRKKEPTAGREW